TGELCMFGKGHGLDKYTCGSGWHGGEGDEVSSVAWTDGPVWLVGKTSMQGAESTDYDTTYMWINPDPYAGEPAISMADAVALTTMKSGFNTIRIEFGGSVGDGLEASFDELRLGTSWSDVSSELEEYVAVLVDEIVPTRYELSQNYPNPFNPTTNINYSLKQNGKVHLAVYDVLGREVAVLVNEAQYAGSHSVIFSGKDLSSGVYFYKLQAADEVFIKKMVLIK
ncbi:T9SS type A sorting domain-containing protein, partial [candidate division KSB1 bacterium]|nr:T9SS type A sorting domain-containing protein [candidate division KSB1 bacterium]